VIDTYNKANKLIKRDEKGKLDESQGRKASDLRRKLRWLSYHDVKSKWTTSLFPQEESGVFLFATIWIICKQIILRHF